MEAVVESAGNPAALPTGSQVLAVVATGSRVSAAVARANATTLARSNGTMLIAVEDILALDDFLFRLRQGPFCTDAISH
jgi:hypothetical protein